MSTSIWKNAATPEILNQQSIGTIGESLGIEFLEVGADYLRARMPVDHRTAQPYGILHGGASVVLAESLGSAAGALCIDLNQFIVVGLEVNANHLRSVRSGFVYGTARPVHLGRKTQVWDIRIETEDGKPVCISRLTIAVLAVTEL